MKKQLQKKGCGPVKKSRGCPPPELTKGGGVALTNIQAPPPNTLGPLHCVPRGAVADIYIYIYVCIYIYVYVHKNTYILITITSQNTFEDDGMVGC